MATNDQREAFRRALQRARRERGWTQRQLATALSVSPNAVSYWERGKSLPAPTNVIELERTLELESGALARLLGYMPLATMQREMASVLDAITADPELDTNERELLATMYRELVRQVRQRREERKSSQSTAANTDRERRDRG
jgi:ribosome-binding protein aMBF1 (putative translation factor)